MKIQAMIPKLNPITSEHLERLANEIEKINSVERYGCAGHNIQTAINGSLKDRELAVTIKKVSKLIAKNQKIETLI